MCFFRVLDSEKDLPQSEQEYGFSPLWILLCFFRSLDPEKDLGHDEHANIFHVSPQILRLRERLSTLGTRIGFFSFMCVLVYVPVARIGEILTTLRTEIGFLSCMGPNVSPQMMRKTLDTMSRQISLLYGFSGVP